MGKENSMLGAMVLESILGAAEKNAEKARMRVDTQENRDKISAAVALLGTKHTFAPGDFVKQKDGIGIYKDNVSCVVRMLEEPIQTTNRGDTGSNIFGFPLDMVVAEINPGGKVSFYHVCSDFFEPAGAPLKEVEFAFGGSDEAEEDDDRADVDD